MNEKTNSRRDFLKKGFLAAAAATAAPLAGKAEATRGEKVKMLTADGKLVEVDKDVLAKASKNKVNNKEILDWRNHKG